MVSRSAALYDSTIHATRDSSPWTTLGVEGAVVRRRCVSGRVHQITRFRSCTFQIMDKYLADYFKPGMENIRMNNGENSISEQHLQAVCRQMLEHAKKIFVVQPQSRTDRAASPLSDQESGRASPLLGSDLPKRNHHNSRRKRSSPNRTCPSDSESDTSQAHTLFVPKKKVNISVSV